MYGVNETRHRLALRFESKAGLVVGQRRLQHLDRHPTPHRLALLGEVHHAHAALTQTLDNLIGVETLDRGRRGHRRGRRKRHIAAARGQRKALAALQSGERRKPDRRRIVVLRQRRFGDGSVGPALCRRGRWDVRTIVARFGHSWIRPPGNSPSAYHRNTERPPLADAEDTQSIHGQVSSVPFDYFRTRIGPSHLWLRCSSAEYLDIPCRRALPEARNPQFVVLRNFPNGTLAWFSAALAAVHEQRRQRNIAEEWSQSHVEPVARRATLPASRAVTARLQVSGSAATSSGTANRASSRSASTDRSVARSTATKPDIVLRRTSELGPSFRSWIARARR